MDFTSEKSELILNELKLVTKDGKVNLQMPDTFYAKEIDSDQLNLAIE